MKKSLFAVLLALVAMTVVAGAAFANGKYYYKMSGSTTITSGDLKSTDLVEEINTSNLSKYIVSVDLGSKTAGATLAASALPEVSYDLDGTGSLKKASFDSFYTEAAESKGSSYTFATGDTTLYAALSVDAGSSSVKYAIAQLNFTVTSDGGSDEGGARKATQTELDNAGMSDYKPANVTPIELNSTTKSTITSAVQTAVLKDIFGGDSEAMEDDESFDTFVIPALISADSTGKVGWIASVDFAVDVEDERVTLYAVVSPDFSTVTKPNDQAVHPLGNKDVSLTASIASTTTNAGDDLAMGSTLTAGNDYLVIATKSTRPGGGSSHSGCDMGLAGAAMLLVAALPVVRKLRK